MSIAVPSWAQADVSSIRNNKSLGQGATRQPLDAGQASQLDAMLSGSMDQLKVVDESDADMKKGQPGVVQQQLPQIPGMDQLPFAMEPPVTSFEGDKTNGSSVTEMNNPMMPMCTVTDYSADSVDTIVLLGGPMSGTQLLHVDRKNPGNSYVEMKGEIWNMMGGAMAQMGMGGGIPGFGG